MKNQGLNYFDIVYYINLQHRPDRNESIINELKKTNIKPEKINRINGIYLENFGSLGCSKSHILALEEFIKTPDEIQNCIIFEDDFIFIKNQDEINKLINDFLNNINEYDILFLSANIQEAYYTEYSYLIKIIRTQTLSGYCVTKKFAPILLDNYKFGAKILEETGHKLDKYCVDTYINELTPYSNLYSLFPTIGIQKESYSDIVKQIVNYYC